MSPGARYDEECSPHFPETTICFSCYRGRIRMGRHVATLHFGEADSGSDRDYSNQKRSYGRSSCGAHLKPPQTGPIKKHPNTQHQMVPAVCEGLLLVRGVKVGHPCRKVQYSLHTVLHPVQHTSPPSSTAPVRHKCLESPLQGPSNGTPHTILICRPQIMYWLTAERNCI